MKKFLTKWYQFQANAIIRFMEVAPSDFIPFLYYVGLDLDEKAISKGIWLD